MSAMQRRSRLLWNVIEVSTCILVGLMLVGSLGGCPLLPATGDGGDSSDDGGTITPDGTGAGDTGGGGVVAGDFVVLGYNDLGMHCMNEDFSELMILPPYNNLHAQVIQRRDDEPHIVSTGVTVRYALLNNTRSADKTNFWTYVQQLLGVTLEPDVGLTSNTLRGTMQPTGNGDWSATGIPVTPIDDDGYENPYPQASIVVVSSGRVVAETLAVVPVSWEMRCDLCHDTPGVSTATDILQDHDRLHGTDLLSQTPVLCASCHADPALDQAGDPDLPNLSRAMHGAHATRVGELDLDLRCYACHPGIVTRCLRDVHFSRGILCTDCHGSMAAVADETRQPWVDEPRCETCHRRSGYEFEQAGTLYRESEGHGGVHCAACHGSPHAITPTVIAADNVQAVGLQGHAGVIDTCTVCHTQTPDDGFFHRLGEEGESEDDENEDD